MKITIAGNGKNKILEKLCAVVLLLLVLSCAATFFLRDYLMNGFYHLYNMIADWFGNHSSLVLPLYELLSEENAAKDMGLLLGMATVVSVTCIFLLFYCFSVGNKKLQMENRYRIIAASCLFMFLLAGIMTGTVKYILPEDKYETPVFVTELKEMIVDAIEEIRYGKDHLNTLPKGDLKKAHIWEGSEEIALKVTMEQPESLYLRGFVGSVYEDNQWKDLSYSTYYEEKDLFYWLHEEGIHADRQISTLWGMLKKKNSSLLAEEREKENPGKGKTFEVQVENVAADREYLYTSYEMTNVSADTADNQGDSYQKSKELFGAKEYSFETYGNLVKDFPQLAAEGYLYKENNDEDAYMEAESHYNVFVYQHYLEVPAAFSSYFKQELGYAGNKEKGHVNYYSAIEKIRTYLEKHMIVGNYGEELPHGEDFLEYFFKESKIGNPVHFATAAVMMFRYYGIPARYVEGYLITPDDVKGLTGKTTVSVAGKNGHAWVEIYVDGLGWVPVEMTQDYYDVMEEPDFLKGLEADSTVVVKEPEKEEEEPDVKEESNLKYKLAGFFIDLAKILLTLLLIFDGLFLLFFLYTLVRRFIANARRRKGFRSADHRLAVQSMVGYMERMTDVIDVEQCGIAEAYKDVLRIGEKAVFSLHEITKEEREQVEECKDHLLVILKKQKGWFEKWVLKYIERLY